jgi:hypothetical protein
MAEVKLHNGMVEGGEQPPIPLTRFNATIWIETSAQVEMTPELVMQIENAIWGCLPAAEDGDVGFSLV